MDGVGAVAVAAKVSEKNLAPVGILYGFKQVAGGLIGEVSVASADALFDGPRSAFVAFQQLRAVVGFDYERVDVADTFADFWRGKAKVGEPGKFFDRGE